MARLSVDHISIDELFKETLPDPHADLESRREYYELDEIERRQISQDFVLSAPVFGRPALVGYMLGQVQQGRGEIEEGLTEYWVFRDKVAQLAHYTLAEGGRACEIAMSSRRSLALINVGRYLVKHDAVQVIYNGDDIDGRGPEGYVEVEGLGSPEEARGRFDETIESSKVLFGEHSNVREGELSWYFGDRLRTEV